ncbi:MAG: hypothetical protein C0464_03445 [Cyanobacteria bacterium DS2.008]|nr:hypothetical protein [Cyanobacteria bacterium DS2.008]
MSCDGGAVVAGGDEFLQAELIEVCFAACRLLFIATFSALGGGAALAGLARPSPLRVNFRAAAFVMAKHVPS